MSFSIRLFKNLSWLLVSDAFTNLILFFLLALTARHYEILDFSNYAFALTFVAFFEIILNFGLNMFIIQRISHKKELAKEYLESMLPLKILLNLIMLTILIPIVQFIDDPNVRFFIYLAAIFVIADSFNQFLRAFFIAFEKFKYDAISKILQTGTRFFVTIIFLYFNLDISFMLYAHIIAAVYTLCYTIITVHDKITRFSFKFNFRLWKQHLNESKYFVLHRLLAYVYIQIDIILLYFMIGGLTVGYYQIAFKTLVIATIAINSLYIAFLPILSASSKSKEVFNVLALRFNDLCFMLMAPITLFLVFFAKKLIPLIFGIKYGPSVLLVQLLAVGFFIFYGPPVGLVFTAKDKQHIIFYTALFGAGINLILNLIFIPVLGALAAALTTIITYTLIKSILAYYYQLELNLNLNGSYKKYLCTILISLILAVILSILEFNIFIALVAYPIACILTFYLFIFSKEDKKLFNKIGLYLLKGGGVDDCV